MRDDYIKIKDLDIHISDGNYSSKYPRSEEFVDEGIPFIRANNLIDGAVSDDDMYHITSKKHAILLKGHVKKDDVLITTRGNIGQVAIVPERHEDSNINAQIVLLRPNFEELNNRYLLWALQSLDAKRQYDRLQTGTALKQLPVGKLKDLSIKIVPMYEQKNIATKLDKCHEIIKLRKKQLEELDTLIKSRFVKMFGDPVSNPYGWKKSRLGNECEVVTGNTPSRKVSEYYGDYIEWIKSDNITSSTYLTLAKEYLSEDGVKVGRTVETGSILMTCIAGSIRSIANVAIADRKVAFNQQINAIVPNDNNTWFMYLQFMMSQQYIRSTINMSLKGILSKGALSDLEFIFPPIETQNEFAKFVQQVDKMKSEVQKSLVETQVLFDSLMQEYFE